MQKSETVFDGFVKLEKWDCGMSFPFLVLRTSNSVAGLLYDQTNKRILLIRQPRPAMVREDNPTGHIIEMVAGRFDVKLSPKALLVKEAKEEAGVEISEDNVELLNDGQPMALSAGILTEHCYLACAIIHPDKVADGEEYGVAEEGEKIHRFWMPLEQFLQGPHEDLRVWAFAQYLGRKIAEG